MTAKKKAAGFVKSADTTTGVPYSRNELEKLLKRYGATGLAISQDYSDWRVTLTFTVPDTPSKGAALVPVRFPIDIKRVYDLLYGRPMTYRYATADQPSGHVFNPKGYETKKLEQAERVAWRNLVLWVDAALSAAAVGLQTVTESLFAHTVLLNERGAQERLIDYVERAEAAGVLTSGMRALLGPGRVD